MHYRAFLFLLCAAAAGAQDELTALGALKLIPKDGAKRLARIEARDGAPGPERWHLLVFDPAAERGVQEFVIAGGKVVAVRGLSQFADRLAQTDVVGGDSVKVDSAQVARTAAVFAAANGARVGTVNYQLSRDETANAPVWTATVLDPAGDQLGSISVNALKGGILSHDGFEKEPEASLLDVTPPGGAARTTKPRAVTATPTPAPKRGLLPRIFGAKDEKPKTPPR